MEQTKGETIGKRIMALRKGMGLTQEQMAEKLGISAQAVSKWENDVSCPDISMLPALASLFNVSVDDLLGVPRQAAQSVEAAARPAWEDGAAPCGQGPDDSNAKSGCPGASGETGGERRRDWGGLVSALVLIGLGITFLLSRHFGMTPNVWDIVWPAVVLGLGVAWFVRELAPLGLGVAFIGFYYLLRNLGQPLPFSLSWDLIWPTALILLGLGALIDCFRWRRRWQEREWGRRHGGPAEYSEEDGRIKVRAVFTEDNRRVKGNLLGGGDVNVVFAGGKLDLTPVTTLGDRDAALLHFHVVFAGYELYVPSYIRIENRISAVFGGVDIHGGPTNPTATLTLTGDVVFGGLDIHYIG